MVKIRQLVRGIDDLIIRGNRELEIRGLTSDSRTASPGDLFLSRKGQKHDGACFAIEAAQAGAVAILHDCYDPFLPLTQLIYPHPEKLEAQLAAKFYRYPSKELEIIGVTGSKGKTTTTYLVRHLLEGLAKPCGLMNTVQTIIGQEIQDSLLTTHEPLHNQKALKEMLDQGSQAAVLEVSSIGAALGRIDEIAFDFALLTNLYPDHLDFHKTIENYAAAKRSFLQSARQGIVLNADDEWTPFMSRGCQAPLLTFGIKKSADVIARDLEHTPYGTRLTLLHAQATVTLSSPLLGLHNVYNLLAAATFGLHLKIPLPQIASILSTFESAPGRLQRIATPHPFTVFVDYAHTGESLTSALLTLRRSTSNRLIVLFGCGGDRDPERRRAMAQAAESLADLSVITIDNPRSESPEEIIREILAAFKSHKNVLVQSDRKKAIELAIQRAFPGDIVLIAGKGHEKTQIFAHQTLAFDDVVVAKEALQKLPNFEKLP